MKILIIEDEKVIALDMKWILEQNGFEVVGISATGEEAIAIAEKSKPDLILMDIILQGDMDGIETAKLIFKKEKIQSLFCTANGDENTIQELKEFQYAGFLKKPLDEEDLLENIRDIKLKRRQAI